MKFFLNLLAIALLASSFGTSAEQKVVKNDWDIHYIAFPSTFLEPKVAKQYGLTRSKYQAVINISVLDNTQQDKAQKASITGFANNLVGQTISLDFKKVVEGEAIYYLSQMQYHDNEPIKFTILVQQGNRTETFKFSKKFYVD